MCLDPLVWGFHVIKYIIVVCLGYDELSSQTQDFTKYGGASQSQSKGSAGSGTKCGLTIISDYISEYYSRIT